MRTTRQLSITLPVDMAEAVRERVRSGEYASESEVIRDGLRALFTRDQMVETWLHGQVASVRGLRRSLTCGVPEPRHRA